jgi:hypothetical protein
MPEDGCHKWPRRPVSAGDHTPYGSEALMTVLTKTHMLQVVRRAYGSDHADSLADRLPDRIDLSDATDARVLSELGLSPDRLFSALGAEL